MMKVSTEDLMDYMDGTLDGARLAAVEEHLRTHAEDAEMIASMKMAQEALGSWDEEEPVEVSPDFWVKVREQLPEQPQRSWFRGSLKQVGAWLWPTHSPARLSLRVGVAAAVLALGAYFFAPEQTRQTAEALPPEATAFIEQSLDRHSAYLSTQPLNGSVTAGDARSAEHGDDDGSQEYTP